MNIIIIEDEPLAAEKLKNLLSEVLPDACVIGIFDSIALTVKWFQQKQNSADLIFMDIHLADGLCFSIFEQVNILSPVIFTTAYDEYALKAFKFNSIDYLLKPISESALKYSIQQYATLKEIWKTPIIDYSLLSAAISGNKKTYKQRFLVKNGNKLISISSNDVHVFYAEEKYVFLIVSSGKKFIINFTLDQLEELLDPDIFFRANRKFILNIAAIGEIHTYFKGRLKLYIPIYKEAEIIVSSEKAPIFKSWLEK